MFGLTRITFSHAYYCEIKFFTQFKTSAFYFKLIHICPLAHYTPYVP